MASVVVVVGLLIDLVEIDLIGLIGISFVQGIGYAIATWFFNRKMEKHFDKIEQKLKVKKEQ